MSLCKYKELFGKPGQDSHTTRIPFVDLAASDVISTIIGAGVISYAFNYNFLYVLIILFVIGIIAHRIFCVRTKLDVFLFPD